jgi:hypothetical protein
MNLCLCEVHVPVRPIVMKFKHSVALQNPKFISMSNFVRLKPCCYSDTALLLGHHSFCSDGITSFTPMRRQYSAPLFVGHPHGVCLWRQYASVRIWLQTLLNTFVHLHISGVGFLQHEMFVLVADNNRTHTLHWEHPNVVFFLVLCRTER